MSNDKFISVSELYTMDYELTDIYAERQTWVDGTLFVRNRPRKSNGIIFLNGSSGKYTKKNGESFYAPCKSLVFLPYTGEYSVLNITSGADTPDAYLAEFNIVQNGRKLVINDTPFLIKETNPYYVGILSENIVTEYEKLIKSPSALKAAIYRLLAYIGEESSRESNRKYLSIAPALDFIKKSPFDIPSVEELADICHVSCGCFRRQFKEYTGKSPKQYIIDKKLDTAKKMLENSGTAVERIAELLGFEDCAYFCRIFKKKAKMTPTEYRNNN